VIDGLGIFPGWISELEHDRVLAALGHDLFVARQMHEDTGSGSRAVVRYGPGVLASGYASGLVIRQIPEVLSELADRLVPHEMSEMADAITVGSYLPGERLGLHHDVPASGEVIACLSMGAPARMIFQLDTTTTVFELAPRTLVVMQGDARHLWMHGILPVAAPRIGIVLRRATV
jgi:hypothetical protein